MKIRIGFISNSSSSSFLISSDSYKQGILDICEKFEIDYVTDGWKDIYTEIINEEHSLYHIFNELCLQAYDMDICCPHLNDRDKYDEVKGEKFGHTIYIPKRKGDNK